MVDDECDEMITNRIRVRKKVLYILGRDWDERESCYMVEMVLCFRTWSHMIFTKSIFVMF